MKKGLIWIIVCLLLCMPFGNVSACTIFSSIQNGQVLVGNNEDWDYMTEPKAWFVPATKHTYGRVCFGFSMKSSAWYMGLLGNYAMGGMNDQGLFVDTATCPKTKAPWVPGRPILIYAVEKFLDKCANVDEALQMVRAYNIPFNLAGIHSHFMFVDKSGSSAVVEWIGNQLRVVRSEKPHQVITNYWLTQPELGGYPCARYNKCLEMLEGCREVSVGYCRQILETVAQSWQTKKGIEGGTLYSNVYDLKNGVVYTYYKRNFLRPICFNLYDELNKGKHVYLLKDF